ncbi:hypothetical protein EGW08_022182 [Elysia chlorotica]|uniref:Uncharacterized protein n=1 Tax=Elysia chlorotica TaxID=188477 RepID=A0A3S0Z3N8_ELYCH|nr:hypothetical protein EGW08_022182 [Elysia chlorotica]
MKSVYVITVLQLIDELKSAYIGMKLQIVFSSNMKSVYVITVLQLIDELNSAYIGMKLQIVFSSNMKSVYVITVLQLIDELKYAYIGMKLQILFSLNMKSFYVITVLQLIDELKSAYIGRQESCQLQDLLDCLFQQQSLGNVLLVEAADTQSRSTVRIGHTSPQILIRQRPIEHWETMCRCTVCAAHKISPGTKAVWKCRSCMLITIVSQHSRSIGPRWMEWLMHWRKWMQLLIEGTCIGHR